MLRLTFRWIFPRSRLALPADLLHHQARGRRGIRFGHVVVSTDCLAHEYYWRDTTPCRSFQELDKENHDNHLPATAGTSGIGVA